MEVGEQTALAHFQFFCQSTNSESGQPFAGGDTEGAR